MSELLFGEDFLQKLERLSLAARRLASSNLQGEQRSRHLGQSVEFSDFRPYVAGDDFRRIDWNAYARLERFFLKLFVEEEDRQVIIMVDASRSMQWGNPDKLDYALRGAGALGYIALAGLDRVSTTLLSSGLPAARAAFPARRGKRSALPFFHFLQQANQACRTAPAAGEDDLLRQLQACAGQRTGGSLLIIFSDLMADAWLDGLRRLATTGAEMVVLHTLAPDEVSPALEGDFGLVDVETEQVVEITASYEVMAHYQQTLLNWQNSLAQFFTARGARYLQVETTLPLEELLFTWLQRYGVLR